MNNNKNARFLFVQRKRIEHDKWCKGCGISDDPGPEYVMDWIQSHAVNFRKAWNQSKCCGCKHHKECGLLVLKSCVRYDPYY